MLFDVTDRMPGKVLGKFRHDPSLHIRVKIRPKRRQRAGWSDDDQYGRRLAAYNALHRGRHLLHEAAFLELMPVGHLHRASLPRLRGFAHPAGTIASLVVSRRILILEDGFNLQVRELLVALVTKEQRLSSVADEHHGTMRYLGHSDLLPRAAKILTAPQVVSLDPDQSRPLAIRQDAPTIRTRAIVREVVMQARDVMVSPVLTVDANATVREVAQLLLARRISAVPVVDADNKILGIVTEGDLMHRAEAGTERSYSWWLRALTGDAQLATDYVKSHAVMVNDIMTRDVVTAAPETPLHEIAMLLEAKQIKRVPIVNEQGQLIGIVSRANLLQAIASAKPALDISLPDSIIKRKLLDELKKQPWAHTFNLNATVQNGIVDLWGFAPSAAERSAIRVAAEAIPGVVTVNDHLLETPVFVY